MKILQVGLALRKLGFKQDSCAHGCGDSIVIMLISLPPVLGAREQWPQSVAHAQEAPACVRSRSPKTNIKKLRAKVTGIHKLLNLILNPQLSIFNPKLGITDSQD